MHAVDCVVMPAGEPGQLIGVDDVAAEERTPPTKLAQELRQIRVPDRFGAAKPTRKSEPSSRSRRGEGVRRRARAQRRSRRRGGCRGG
jgi:hypothetical protein